MSHHEFGIMQISPQNGQRFDEYEPEKYNCISVNDDYIGTILEKLNDIDFYWHTRDVSGKGIAYCGITLIPPSSMEEFISVIENNSKFVKCVFKGRSDEIKEKLEKLSPVVIEELPLDFEKVFISEVKKNEN